MTKRNFSYFEACLKIFLTQYHPLLADDIDYIEERAKESEVVYNELVSERISCHTANKVAMNILFDGLEFSPYQILYELMCRDFKEIPLNSCREVAITLLPDCIGILEKYPEYRHNQRCIEMELTGIISTYLLEKESKAARI